MNKKKLSMYELKKSIQLTSLALPAIILVFIFAYIPMGGVILAFKDYNYIDGILGSPWIGMKNFEFFFKNDAFMVTRNTLLYNLVFIIVGLIFALIFAMLLNELTNRAVTKFYQTVFFFPYFFSWVIVAYMVYAFMAPNGILPSGAAADFVMNTFGANIKEFYTTPSFWPGFLVFLNTWKGLGYSSVLYYAAIMGISSDYYEAAELDGASRLQQAWYVTLPLLLPLISIMTLLSVGGIFRSDFGLFYFVPREIGKLFSVTSVIDVHVYRMLRVSNDIGMAAAIGLYQSVLCFVLVLVSNFTVKKIDPEYSAF